MLKNFKPIKKYEKLTLRTISHAFFAADSLKLEGVIDEGEKFFKKTDLRGMNHRFEFHFDHVFKMYFEANRTPDEVSSLVVELKNEEHHLVPYYFYNENSSDEYLDKELEWTHEGPWIRMIEGKVRKIFEIYQYYLQREKEKKERSEEYFKNYFKERQKWGSSTKISLKDVVDTLNSAKELGIIIANIYHRTSSYRFKNFILNINFDGEATMNLSLKDGENTMGIYSGGLNQNGEFILNESIWANALMYSLEKIKEEVKDVSMKKSEYARYFLEV